MKLRDKNQNKKQGRKYYIDDDGRAVCASCRGKRFITSQITKKKFYKPGREKHWERKSRKEVTTECGNCYGEGVKDWVDFLRDGGFKQGNFWHWNGIPNQNLWFMSSLDPNKNRQRKKYKEELDIEWILTEKK